MSRFLDSEERTDSSISMPAPSTRLSSTAKRQRVERLLGIFALVTIVAAWLFGSAAKDSSYEKYLPQALPSAAHFSELDDGLYAGLAEDGNTITGYVAVGQATGYGGPIELAVAVDLQGNIIGIALVEDRETPAYLVRVIKNSFLEGLLGKSYADQFELGEDVDGVTQATYTSSAMAEAVRQASRIAAHRGLSQSVPVEAAPKVKFGVPEIAVIVLFIMGYVGRQKIIKHIKILRWITMISGLMVLGFLYNQPLTVSKINTFLLGFWPPWQANLYWYLLIGGIIFVFTADNRNPYCEWFCPFGAAQECMGAIGGAKMGFTKNQQYIIAWVQRGLAWFAIIVALLLRNPGISSYEVFGGLFKLNGSTISFVTLGVVLIASMFIHRFWCRVLCPIRPVEAFIRMIRGWIVDSWKQKSKARSSASS